MVYKDGKPIITTLQVQSVNLTWDEYQALPATKLTDGVYYNITDWEQSTLDIVNVLSGENIALQQRIAELENANTYSTEEVRIGTWLDGKPHYKVTIDFGSLPNKTSKLVAYNLTDKKVTKVYGYSRISTGITVPIPTVSTVLADNNGVVIRPTGIEITTGTDKTMFTETFVTIEYTKTTD